MKARNNNKQKPVNIKFVCFDFDDTLVLHRAQLNDYAEYLAELSNKTAAELYKDSIIPEAMKKFVLYCRELGMTLACLTHISDQKEYTNKVEYLEQMFGVDIFNGGYFGTVSAEQKVDVMKSMSTNYLIPPNQILLVDDKISTLNAAKKAGFSVMKPLEVLWTNGNDKKMHELFTVF